jgi:phosphate transport system permease protein
MSLRRVVGAWPRVVSPVLALIPVGMLVLIAYILVSNSMLAIDRRGLGELFSTHFAGAFSGANIRYFGLLPAIWGTVLIGALSLAIALPVSVAVALLASEFRLGPIGHILEGLLGLLAGIPPIVYAILGVVLVEWFIRPKFGAPALSPEQVSSLPGLTWYNPGMLPNEQSALLAAMLLALLIIPFVAPLMLDAIRTVPPELKEASFALGADRWHTVKRVVFPYAMPGIVSAVVLGALKSMGDVMIVIWAVGYQPSGIGMPNPLWDVLERIVTLTSAGAGLAGGTGWERFRYELNANLSEAYFAGLLILVMAFVILFVASFLQRRLQKRLAL